MFRWILESVLEIPSVPFSNRTTKYETALIRRISATDIWSTLLRSAAVASRDLSRDPTELFLKWIVIFILAVGCGGGAATTEGSTKPREIKAAASIPSDSKLKNARVPNRSEERRANSGREETVHLTAVPIPRVDLLVVLEEGIPRFLQNVRVEPRFLEGRFFGWQVISLYPDDPRFNQSSIRPGDIVIDVNGRSVERPEGLKVLWDDLASASNLRFTVLREGRTYLIDYEITE